MRERELTFEVSHLLAVATGDESALASAEEQTGCTRDLLLTAASFFIEQVMLDRQSDAYRVLGCAPTSSRAELRRNMALMMKWLHPDRTPLPKAGTIDRSVYVTRVTEAWECLKTEERRSSFDLGRSPVTHDHPHAKKRRPAGVGRSGVGEAIAADRARRSNAYLVSVPLPRRKPPLRRLWSGLLSLFRIRR